MLLIIVHEIGCDVIRLITLIPKHIINISNPFEFAKSCWVKHIKYPEKLTGSDINDLQKRRGRDQYVLLIIESLEPHYSLPYMLTRFADFIMIQDGKIIRVVKDRINPPCIIPIP